MSSELAIRPTASNQLAAFIGMEPRMMLDTIKAQCFKCDPARVSDAQLAAFVSIANEMRVNPLLPGMLWAYPTQNGIVPMIGPDGVFKKLTEHPDVNSWETVVFPEDVSLPPTHATTKIYRKGTDRPLTYTAVLSEWKISSNPNWNSRPRHMLALRSLKQGARQIIHGIPMDEDERVIADAINVTPESEQPAQTRPEPPPRQPRKAKGANAVQEVVVEQDKTTAAPVEQTSTGTPPPEPAPTTSAPATPAAAGAMPRLTLAHDEKFDCVVTVEDSKIIAISGVPAVAADVVGGYKGVLYQKNTFVLGEDKKPLLPPMWQKGSRLNVSLIGYKNMNMRYPSTKDPVTGELVKGALLPDGKMQVYVEKATPADAPIAPQETPEEF